MIAAILHDRHDDIVALLVIAFLVLVAGAVCAAKAMGRAWATLLCAGVAVFVLSFAIQVP